jgi:serine/threonine protein phosphatase PrpC
MSQETPTQLSFRTGASSHTGRVRATNEDRFVARPDLGLWAVADGMGGHEAGELASSTLAEALNSVGKADSAADLLARVEKCIARANMALRREGAARGSLIGSTLATLLVHGARYACLWSGDSRVYRLRDGEFRQITRDHSAIQELVDSGALTPEQARTSPHRNVVTRAIGVSRVPELELVEGEVLPHDRFLICSDGLYGHVDDPELHRHLEADDPRRACSDLVSLTLDRGASDNVTVVIVLCESAPPAREP